MNLKKILSLSLLLSIIPLTAYSQPVQIETTDNFTYFGIGTTTINTDNVNKSLSSLGYPNFPSNATFFGGGNRSISGRIVTGAEGFATIENKIINTQNGHRGFNSSSFNMIGGVYLKYETYFLSKKLI